MRRVAVGRINMIRDQMTQILNILLWKSHLFYLLSVSRNLRGGPSWLWRHIDTFWHTLFRLWYSDSDCIDMRGEIELYYDCAMMSRCSVHYVIIVWNDSEPRRILITKCGHIGLVLAAVLSGGWPGYRGRNIDLVSQWLMSGVHQTTTRVAARLM